MYNLTPKWAMGRRIVPSQRNTVSSLSRAIITRLSHLKRHSAAGSRSASRSSRGSSRRIGSGGTRRGGSRRGGGRGGTGSRRRAGPSHLHGDAATEGTGLRRVDQLDDACVGLAGDVSGAVGALGYVDLEGEVLVDVGRALHDADRLQGADPESLLRLPDVAVLARHLSRDLQRLPVGSGAVGVDHGLVRSGAVRSDDVQCTRQRASGGDLWESAARECHCLLGASIDLVISLLRKGSRLVSQLGD